MRHQTRRGLAVSALVTVTGLLAVACGGGEGSAGADGKIEISIGTFNEFGYEKLYAEYERLHPNIDIVPHKAGSGGPHHQSLFTKLGANSGLDDIMAVEEGYLAEVLDNSGRFHDLAEIGPDVPADRWLDWKYQAGRDRDGKLVGYGTDIGPLAMCYRKDLFAAAGLPTDPEDVKPLFETWDSYFAAGDEFIAASDGTAWFDSSSQIFNAMHNQLEVGFFDRQNNLRIESNPRIRQNWDKVTAAARRGQSAGLSSFSNEWNSGFKQSAFATTVCPAWMLGVIEGQAGPEHAGKWAVTDAFPGGSGNWGGSYLTVPRQTEHPEEAAALAAWLTAPEQQVKAFQAGGGFPSQTKALDSPELLSMTDDYFGGAEIGELYAAQARKVEHAQYKGPGDGEIQENAATPALRGVEQGNSSPEQAWRQFVDTAERIAR